MMAKIIIARIAGQIYNVLKGADSYYLGSIFGVVAVVVVLVV
jgi:hypothetical protein